MGKKGSNSKASAANFGHKMSVTLREATTGKKHTNVKSALKLEHLKNLAVWASHDAAVPSLAAFFGHHFASSSEALAIPVDPSLFTCQRCESILHPGNNCTIRIEKYKANPRKKRKKNTNYPQNNIVYTCHFCSHRNIKRGTPRNTSPPKVKAHPKSSKQRTSDTVSSSDLTNNKVVANANFIAAPLNTTTYDSNMSKMGIVEINETLKVNDDSAGINTIEVPQGPTADDSNMVKMGIIDINETKKINDDSAGINTIEVPQGPTADDSNMVKMGIEEVNETLKVNDDSADMNTIEIPQGPTADDSNMVKMGIEEANETLKVNGNSADINTIEVPQGPTADDSNMVKMGIEEVNETLKVNGNSADINTIEAPLGPTADDPSGKTGIMDITETIRVKNDSAASSPTTPSTRPPLTLLEIKMGKRNRSKIKKKVTSETPNAEKSDNTSKRKRRKSWTSLKEIAENDNGKTSINFTIPFAMQ